MNLLKSILESTWKRLVLYLIIGIIIVFLMGLLIGKIGKPTKRHLEPEAVSVAESPFYASPGEISSSPPPIPTMFCWADETGEILSMWVNDKGKLEIEGDMTEGAELFFEYTLKPMVDDYIKRKLEEGR